MKIDHTYVLNLEHRKDRLTKVIPALYDFCKGTGLPFARVFKAVNGKELFPDYEHAGRIGFNLSFQKIFTDALLNEYEAIAVFEDDVVLSKNAVEVYNDCINSVPEDWQLFYLGANTRQQLSKVNASIYRLVNAWTTHAIIYKRSAIEYIMQNYLFPEIIVDSTDVFDEWLRAKGQEALKCYILKPIIATQAEGWSDLENKDVDYNCISYNADKHLR